MNPLINRNEAKTYDFDGVCEQALKGGPKGIVEGRQVLREENLPRVTVHVGECEFSEHENNVLVEVVAAVPADAPVA